MSNTINVDFVAKRIESYLNNIDSIKLTPKQKRNVEILDREVKKEFPELFNPFSLARMNKEEIVEDFQRVLMFSLNKLNELDRQDKG